MSPTAFLTIRATPADLTALAELATAIRQRTGSAFVSRSQVVRYALDAALNALGRPSHDATPAPGAR
jgi:hypothetical protein